MVLEVSDNNREVGGEGAGGKGFGYVIAPSSWGLGCNDSVEEWRW